MNFVLVIGVLLLPFVLFTAGCHATALFIGVLFNTLFCVKKQKKRMLENESDFEKNLIIKIAHAEALIATPLLRWNYFKVCDKDGCV